MSLNREVIVAAFEKAFGEETAKRLYTELNEDTKVVMPNTGIFSRRSVHQAIMALIECTTTIKPNKETAAYWNDVYEKFVQVVPSVEVAAVADRKIVALLTPEERAAEVAAKLAREEEQREKNLAAQNRWMLTPEDVAVNTTETESDDDKIPF